MGYSVNFLQHLGAIETSCRNFVGENKARLIGLITVREKCVMRKVEKTKVMDKLEVVEIIKFFHGSLDKKSIPQCRKKP